MKGSSRENLIVDNRRENRGSGGRLDSRKEKPEK
jgi:hypothetical protein